MYTIPVGNYAERIKDIAWSVFVEKCSFIEQPIAAAMGVGLDVSSQDGYLIVDIGHMTTDIAIISKGKVVCSSSTPFAGRQLNEDIRHYLEDNCDLWIGETTAQKVKHEVGAAIQVLPREEIPEDFYVRGVNGSRSGWSEAYISYEPIASCLDASLSKIEMEIKAVLEHVPSKLIDDISKNGIWLVGGSSRLRGIGLRFSDNLGIKCYVPNTPELVTARGAAMSLKT